MHLAAPDVHVVGEGVRELHRDRPDLATDTAEVVEEPCALTRELWKERCEPKHVHRGRVYSGLGGFRSAFVRARRRFPSRRRWRALAPGRVGTRRRGTASASRSFWTRRSTASSRLRAWLRSSCATARRTAPARPDDAVLLDVRERRRRLDVERRFDPRRGLLRVLSARPARPRHTKRDLRDGQED